jgi:hypothetical protein
VSRLSIVTLRVLVLWPAAFAFGVGMIASAVVLGAVARVVERWRA